MTTTYSVDEVYHLVQNYLELRGRARLADKRNPGDNSHAALMDVQRCMKLLPVKLRQIVFLVGVANQTTREAGEKLFLDFSNVAKGYHRGIGRLHVLMNGG